MNLSALWQMSASPVSALLISQPIKLRRPLCHRFTATRWGVTPPALLRRPPALCPRPPPLLQLEPQDFTGLLINPQSVLCVFWRGAGGCLVFINKRGKECKGGNRGGDWWRFHISRTATMPLYSKPLFPSPNLISDSDCRLSRRRPPRVDTWGGGGQVKGEDTKKGGWLEAHKVNEGEAYYSASRYFLFIRHPSTFLCFYNYTLFKKRHPS